MWTSSPFRCGTIGFCTNLEAVASESESTAFSHHSLKVEKVIFQLRFKYFNSGNLFPGTLVPIVTITPHSMGRSIWAFVLMSPDLRKIPNHLHWNHLFSRFLLSICISLSLVVTSLRDGISESTGLFPSLKLSFVYWLVQRAL